MATTRIPVSLPTVHGDSRTLAGLLATCRDDIASQYLVHHRPKRKSKSKEKGDYTQLSPKQISDGFAAARDAAGVCADYYRAAMAEIEGESPTTETGEA